MEQQRMEVFLELFREEPPLYIQELEKEALADEGTDHSPGNQRCTALFTADEKTTADFGSGNSSRVFISFYGELPAGRQQDYND